MNKLFYYLLCILTTNMFCLQIHGSYKETHEVKQHVGETVIKLLYRTRFDLKRYFKFHRTQNLLKQPQEELIAVSPTHSALYKKITSRPSSPIEKSDSLT